MAFCLFDLTLFVLGVAILVKHRIPLGEQEVRDAPVLLVGVALVLPLPVNEGTYRFLSFAKGFNKGFELGRQGIQPTPVDLQRIEREVEAELAFLAPIRVGVSVTALILAGVFALTNAVPRDAPMEVPEPAPLPMEYRDPPPPAGAVPPSPQPPTIWPPQPPGEGPRPRDGSPFQWPPRPDV